MNRKQLVILLVLVVVVGGAGLAVYKRQQQAQSAGNSGIGKKLLGEFPVNDVTQLTIKDAANAATLIKKDDTWRVAERNDYPADFSRISGFLLKLRDLKAVQTEQVGASQMTRLALTPGSGTNSPTVVEFKDASGKAMRTLLLGKMHLSTGGTPSPMGEGGWPDGRYVKVGTDATEVAVVSEPLDDIEPKPESWLSKEFFHIEKARSVEVSFPIATNSWKLTRETESGEWKLVDAKPEEQLDSAKTSSISTLFSAPSFTDVLAGDQLATVGTNQPALIKVETFDGFGYTVKIGSKTNEDYLLTVAVAAQLPKERTPGKEEKPEDKAKLDKEFQGQQQKLADKLKQEQAFQKWTYLVAGWTVDPALKERSQLLAEKKDDTKEVSGSMTNSLNSVEEPKLEDPALPAIHQHP
jgi:hypothetical protein